MAKMTKIAYSENEGSLLAVKISPNKISEAKRPFSCSNELVSPKVSNKVSSAVSAMRP